MCLLTRWLDLDPESGGANEQVNAEVGASNIAGSCWRKNIEVVVAGLEPAHYWFIWRWHEGGTVIVTYAFSTDEH